MDKGITYGCKEKTLTNEFTKAIITFVALEVIGFEMDNSATTKIPR